MQCVTVFCGSSEGNDPLILDLASQLGTCLAANNITLVYGAAKIGVMAAVAQSCLDKEGRVIGVIPRFLTAKEVVHLGLTKLEVVETMHERKARMNDLADGFIVLPGGFGTMEEFFEVLTWAQLGLHLKPIALLNVNHFFDSLFDFLQNMVDKSLLKEENLKLIISDSDPEKLLDKMRNYEAPAVPKWLPGKQFT